MKKYFLLVVITVISISAFSQKYAVIDSEYILSKIPNYKAAIEQVEKLSMQYQRDVQSQFDAIQQELNAYHSEKVLLTEEMKKSREAEIQQKQLDANELQRKYFGPDGLLFKKREELLKPFYDMMMNAVKGIAASGSYQMILDKANNPSIMFANPKIDKSDEVLQKLGYK